MQTILKTTIATIALTAIMAVPASAITQAECQQIQQTANQMAECARQLGYPEDSVIIQEAQKKWWEALNEEQELTAKEIRVPPTTWTGSVLTRAGGVNYGPSGKETYYNLPMGGIVRTMRNLGYDEIRYPYWTREDGMRMIGGFIMAAADLRHYPMGSVVESSRGWTLICDTGYLGWDHLDLACNW